MLCGAKDETGARAVPDGSQRRHLADGGLLLGWDEKYEQIR
ncbi:hypothetical protein [Kribbella sp. NPDC000426]